jgi:hypothetical protein
MLKIKRGKLPASPLEPNESDGCKSKHAYETHSNDSDSDDEIDTDYLWYSKEAEPGSRIIEAQEQQHHQESPVKCMAIHTRNTLASGGSTTCRVLPINIRASYH